MAQPPPAAQQRRDDAQAQPDPLRDQPALLLLAQRRELEDRLVGHQPGCRRAADLDLEVDAAAVVRPAQQQGIPAGLAGLGHHLALAGIDAYRLAGIVRPAGVIAPIGRIDWFAFWRHITLAW